MRHVRFGVSVLALFTFAGLAGAQPASFPMASPAGPISPAFPSVMPPAAMPPAATPSGNGSATTAQPIHALGALTEEHSPMKDLTPHGGFGDLIPHPDKHHGGHHEIPGYLTPLVPEHGGFYTNAEFLLMRPRNSDFDFVIRNQTVGLATNGPIDSFKYSVGTGVRAEVGYMYDSHWETGFAYTYFNGGADSTLFAGGAQTLLPTLTRPGLTDRALTASGAADLDYQLYDMIVGRRFVIQENLAMRAIGGFRFTDTRQTLNAFYDGLDARRAAVRTRSRFQGFGPILGAEAVLSGPMGFHFYTRATAGLLTGNSVNSLLETNDNGASTYINTRYDVRKVVPMGSLAIGGGWQYRSIAIRAGYEVTHMQGIFERPRFVDDVSQGKVITRPSNLSLEGLFIQATLNF